MNLDTLDSIVEKKVTKPKEETGEKETVIVMERVVTVRDLVVKDEEFPDEDSDDDDKMLELETNLSNCLSLLEDCNGLLTTLADRDTRFITPYMRGEIERLNQEATAYLVQYEVDLSSSGIEWETDV